MADDLCFFSKDSSIFKAPKKSSLVLRMLVLGFVVVCSVYIYEVCLKQFGFSGKSELFDVEVVEKPCMKPNVELWEIPYVHYPKPKTYSRAECVCNPVRYFAILSMQRSGSGWFETLLNNHTNISSNGEVFSVKVRRSNVSMIIETLDKLYNLDWLSSASKNECTAAVGLKWMLNQGVMQYHEDIVQYFKTKGVSAIFLFRRNLLRRMISVLANSYDRDAKLLNGTHKSHVHSPHEAEILASYKPSINATSLISSLRQVEDMTAKALEYFKSTRHMILYYEDIVKNHTELFDVEDFLKVPHRDLYSRQVKIHKGPLSSQIENWEEVEKALKGTHYESLLHENKAGISLEEPWRVMTLYVAKQYFPCNVKYLATWDETLLSFSPVSSVKIIRNKQTGQLESYGFVECYSHATAEKVLQNYNGDLAADFTDAMLQESFATKYPSVKGAQVVTDSNTGCSKGYGFVRFGHENERTRAMEEMNGVYCSRSYAHSGEDGIIVINGMGHILKGKANRMKTQACLLLLQLHGVLDLRSSNMNSL